MLLNKGKTSRTVLDGRPYISNDVLTWLPLEGLWRGVGWGGWGVMAPATGPPTPQPLLPVLPACPGRPSSCLLSGDSVQPTVGCVEGAQRDQLQRMVPTQNPRRGNAVRRFGVGWVEERGVGGTYPSCNGSFSESGENREKKREAARGGIHLHNRHRHDAQKRMRSMRRGGKTKSGRGVTLI